VARLPREPREPLARLRLRGTRNYFHCLEPAPPGVSGGRLAALTGSVPRQCDTVAILSLDGNSSSALRLEQADAVDSVHDLGHRTRAFPDRAVLCVRWARQGELLLMNTRPRLMNSKVLPEGETVLEALSRPAPPLATTIELIVLDALTLSLLSTHGGHYAFTTAEAPFILHVDSWADADLIASGGEDSCVHVWHRRHGRQLQRLEGHSKEVNAVSWCQAHSVLASASDDHAVILWGCGRQERSE